MSDKKKQQAERIQRYAHMIEQHAGKAVRPYRADGYVNMMNRYGTAKDATEHYHFAPEPDVPDDSLTLLYEGNGLFAKVIDAPAEEAIKHGFTLEDVSDQEVETFYQEALDELDWEEVAMTGIKWARLFGGAIAVMLINDGGGLEEPLNWKKIKSIDDIRVYDRSVVQPDFSTMFSYDPRHPFSTRGSRLGMPEFYRVNSRYGSFVVHESRCLVFQNGVLPENSSNTIYQFWGMPEYIRIHRALRDAEVAHGSGPKMLDRSVQPVYKMKDLAALLATEEGESQVLKRLQVIDLARGLLNSLVIDNEGEDYDFKSFQYTGVSDVIAATCSYLSALTNIPQAILFGFQPIASGDNGESDRENWYSYCGRIQKRMLKSNLRYLLSVIFRAGAYTGEVDEVPKIKIKFNALKTLSDSEQAELDNKKASTQLIKAQTVQIYRDMEVIDSLEIRKKLADSGEFEIDTILDEYEDEEELLAAYTGQEVAPGFSGNLAESGDFNQYATEVNVEEHENDPGTVGSAPANAPAATKLPQDMSEEETEEITNQDEAPYGVGVLVVKDGRILCGTRHNDTGYGLICGPGGHGEKGETYEQSAFRETEEEFGISPKELIPIGVGPFEPESGLRSHIFLCTDFDGEPDCVDLEMTNPKFRSLEELEELKPSLFPPFRDSLEILMSCLNPDDPDDDPDNHDGGPGSGNHGHEGRPGKVGGAAPGDGTSYRGSSGEKCREYSSALSSKTKAQLAKQASKDPEFKKLTDAISLYTQGGYAQQRQVAEKLVDGSFREEDDFTVGKFVQDNRFMVVKDLYKGQGLEESTSSTADGMAQLIGAINESEPYEGKLYRAAQDRNIIKVGGDYTPFVIPEVGQTVQLSAPTSFTTDKAVADKLMMQKMGDKIFYTIDEGASAVDVSKLSPYKQKEMLTCGTYEVVAVKKTETKNFIVGGEQYATKAQKERGLVDNWGAPHYITYDVEIQLRQVGKVSIGTKSDSEDEHIILSGEQFEDRMVLTETDISENISAAPEKPIDFSPENNTIKSQETSEDGAPKGNRNAAGPHKRSHLSEVDKQKYTKRIVGQKTSDGVTVTGFIDHAFDRVAQRNISMGQIEQMLRSNQVSPDKTYPDRNCYDIKGKRLVLDKKTGEIITVEKRRQNK